MAAPDLESLLAGGPMMEVEEVEEFDVGDEGMKAAAGDLIAAVKSGDESAVVASFRAMFDLLESQPHIEDSVQMDELE
jgi:hypothetical protein